MQGLNLLLKGTREPEALMTQLQHLNRWLCGMQTRYQKSGGFIWPYLEGGSGYPVVLLHGFGADKDRFGSLVPFLRRSFHVIIPDIPGFGDHALNWSASYTIDSQVERLDGFLRAIGLVRFHLMGLSMGGYLAGLYATRYPQRVGSLALMDSAGFSTPVPSDAQRLFEQGGRNIFLYTNELEMQEMMDFLFHQPLKLPAEILRYWSRQGLARRQWREKLFTDLLNGGIHGLDSRAGDIKAPTLVIWGADDRICHVSAVDRILLMVKDCRAFIIHSCGHIPMIEYPLLFQKLYIEFLVSLF